MIDVLIQLLFCLYYLEGMCIPGMITEETWHLNAPIYTEGNVTFYAPWIMEATANYRGMSLRGYVDGVALMSCEDLGANVWLRRPGHGWEGPFLSVDCAQRNHMYAAIRYKGEIVEIGWKTAERWGMTVGIFKKDWQNWVVLDARIDNVEMSLIPPHLLEHNPIPDDFLLVPYRDWWLEQVEFE